MTTRSSTQQALAHAAEKVYDERLKQQLERDHFGEVIALEPDTGDYVLGKDFREVSETSRQRFGRKQVYIFRVGGGGALKIGGVLDNARVSGRI
ncbi:MAG TPA: hypothetical protein VK137_00865 [Planctomycetaceae bacterium]|nr:hypothetical protein [Planctomycetaceae bacterium]